METDIPLRIPVLGLLLLSILVGGLPRWYGKVVKNLAANVRDIGDEGLIPRSGRSPGGGHGIPLCSSCLENPHGQGSLAGYSPWGLKESDRTEAT